jgi:hypothetical protein
MAKTAIVSGAHPALPGGTPPVPPTGDSQKALAPALWLG